MGEMQINESVGIKRNIHFFLWKNLDFLFNANTIFDFVKYIATPIYEGT